MEKYGIEKEKNSKNELGFEGEYKMEKKLNV